MLEPEAIERALVITAHPDDVDFGAAGTVAVLTDAGVSVTYCLVTDGEAGGFDLEIARPAMAAMRREEQTAAAAEVGVTELCFLGHPDGQVVASLELRHELAGVIRQVRPQVVITQSPELHLDRIYASHPDHRATGEAALAAVYPDARNPFAFPELLHGGAEPWSVDEVWLMTSPGGTGVVDVTAQVERKIRALRSHHTQFRDPDAVEATVRTWMQATAQTFDLPDGASAELFRVVNTR